MSDTPKEYLARIGAKGGKKSRRKLSTQEASKTARARWGKPKKNQPGGAGASPAELAGSRSVKKHPESPGAEEKKPALISKKPTQPTMSESEAETLARLNNHQLRTK